jgi:uncharacterized membrane protein
MDASRIANENVDGKNIGNAERWISAAAGGALIAYGLRRRSRSGTALALSGGALLLRGALGKSLIYRVLGINTAQDKAKELVGSLPKEQFRIENVIVIDRPAEEVYRFWRNFENLPRVMDHLQSVRSIDGRRSHWVAKAPAGMHMEWDAEITDENENRFIAWRSLEGSEIRNEGAVLFEPIADGAGCELRVSLEYQQPGGKAGKAFAKLFGKDPQGMIEKDLARLKVLMESGETVIQGKAANA